MHVDDDDDDDDDNIDDEDLLVDFSGPFDIARL